MSARTHVALVCAALLCTVLHAEELKRESFEAVAPGASPAGWSVHGPGGVTDRLAAAGTGKCLELRTVMDGKRPKYGVLRASLPPVDHGVLRVRYWARAGVHAVMPLLYLRRDGVRFQGHAVAVAFWHDGWVQYNDAGKWRRALRYKPNVWYPIGYDVCLATRTYDLYVGDRARPVRTGVRFRSPTAGRIDSLFAESNESGPATLWLDEISVESAPERPIPEALMYHRFRLLPCHRTDAAPVIDGDLADAAWARAPQARLSLADGGPPAEPTDARVLWDDQCLYLGFVCSEARMAALKADVTERDGRVWTDDAIEFFLDPDRGHERYFHLVANAAGVQYDRQVGANETRDWDADWRVAVARGKTGWTVEAAVPFAALGGTPAAGAVWRGNLNREHRSGETSSWVPMKQFHSPAKFGHLLFVDEPFLARADWPQTVMDQVLSLRAAAEQGESALGEADRVPGELRTMELVRAKGAVRKALGQVKAARPPNQWWQWEAQADGCLALADAVGKLRQCAARLRAFAAMNEADRRKGYGLLVASTMDKVFRDAWSGQPAGAIEVALARNEYEGAQLVVAPFPNRTLGDVSVSASDLRHANGQGAIPARHMEVCLVEDIRTVPPYYEVDRVGWWPDVLLANRAAPLTANQVQRFWVTVFAPAHARPGDYAGALTARVAGSPETVLPMRVHVWDFALPKRSRFKTVFCLQQSFMKRYYGKSLTRQDVLRFESFVLRHRVNPVDLWSDFYSRREDLDTLIGRGQNLVCVKILGKDVTGQGTSYEDYLRERIGFLKSKGWADLAFAFGFDEVLMRRQQLPQMKRMYGLTRHIAPDLPRMCTVHVAPELEGVVDIWCPLMHQYDHAKAQARRAAGDEMWWYLTDAPRAPYPNLNIDSPGIDPRIIPWLNWKLGVTGLLYWSLNRAWVTNVEEYRLLTSAEIKKGELDWVDAKTRERVLKQGVRWPDVPWIPYFRNMFSKRINWSNGAGSLVYPGADRRPVGSVRLANLRDGIEDYDYLAMLADLLKRVESTRAPVGRELLSQARAALAVSPQVAASVQGYTKDGSRLLAERRRIAELIEQLQVALKR